MNFHTLLLAVLLVVSCRKSVNSQDIDPLNKMAEVLNNAVPIYRELYDPEGFFIKEGIPANFFVYNLIDTTNNAFPPKFPIKLEKNGIYHFSPVFLRFSYSYIAVVKEGNLKFFGFLNCKGTGDDIADVVDFVKKKFDWSEEVLARIRNYRSHGRYIGMDPQSNVECP